LQRDLTTQLNYAAINSARLRQHKVAVKTHILLDSRGNIPTLMSVTGAKAYDVNILNKLVIECLLFSR
jgi:hypothetical protein